MENKTKEKKEETFSAESSVLKIIKKIPQQSQVQYDLTRQLMELRVAANKLGLYDAADYLRNFK